MNDKATPSGRGAAAKAGTRRRLIMAALTCLISIAAAVGPGVEPAAARPLWSGDYARAGLAYEGSYPDATPCDGEQLERPPRQRGRHLLRTGRHRNRLVLIDVCERPT